MTVRPGAAREIMRSVNERSAKEDRIARVLDVILENRSVLSSELAALLGVSLMTIHRDIDVLVSRGLVRRFHGGASAEPSTVFESSSAFRMHINNEVKQAMAERAIELIEPGMSVLLDDSTSALAVARRLQDVGPLTVVTNYRPIIEELVTQPDMRLIVIGGDYSQKHDSFLGVGAEDAVSRLSVDIGFFSTSAMTSEMVYHQEQHIIQIKRPMMRACAKSVLLMDATKLGRAALYRLAPTESFSHVVIGGSADPGIVEGIREHAQVLLAAGGSAS